MILLAKELLERAVDICYGNEFDLITAGYERTIIPHIYSEMMLLLTYDINFNSLSEFNLDNEYERHNNEKKMISNGKKVRPDIILHKRNTDINLLVVEFKTDRGSNTDLRYDKEKLAAFTNSDSTLGNQYYHYKLGVLVKLLPTGVEYIYFQNGQEVQQGDIIEE